MGCDQDFCERACWLCGFQSTHPHGVRPGQPESRIKSDIISIHAPAWGATLAFAYLYRRDRISIHAPAWGATN